jgi:hypothetical protein
MEKTGKERTGAKENLVENENREGEMENCVVEFTPKKSKMTTFGRVGFVDTNGCCHVRVCITIDKRKRRAKGKRYYYGAIQLTGLNPELEGEVAYVQICVPQVPADSRQFLDEPFESWPKLIKTESLESRENTMKKSIAEKIRNKLSNGKKGDWQ